MIQIQEKWQGQSLDGKKIRINAPASINDFYYQIRLLNQIKKQWNCHLTVCCQGQQAEFADLESIFSCIDEVCFDQTEADFFIDIFDIPNLINNVHLNLPEIKQIDKKYNIVRNKNNQLVGLNWGNMIPKSVMAKLESGFVDLYQLKPHERLNFATNVGCNNLLEIASLISEMDKVVTIESDVMHLSILMKKPTLVIFPKKRNHFVIENFSFFYPDVQFIIENKDDWEYFVDQIREFIGSN